ncbi:hypothetical protein IMZ48_45800, partial [Candidatus Bathyarchaeota archaeon]|nr:hypothetical protein [Candidatus Bathyarchaeota archaeon]
MNAQNSTRSGRASGPQSRASDEAVRAFESNQNMRGFTAPGARATSPEQLELSDEDAITNGQTD